ncbi:MAG: D-threitol dehydrogenase [Hyphomicrobiales bacterium]|nr:D-threitol dehydrogenase [Hyphomicrobiales bacterium]
MPRDPASLDFDFPLTGKAAIITGAASGIGSAIADAFAAKGVRLALLDLNLDGARSRASTLGNATAYGCDVTDPSSVEGAVASVANEFQHIDILVNSAGVVDLAPAENISTAAWQHTLNVNLTGTFLMAQAVGRRMLAQGHGKIVNLASQAGSVAIEEHIAYCASKFGVIGLTKTLALEWGGRGVNVNSISPTVVLTELGKKAWAGEKGDAMIRQIPSGRFAEPDEIAAAAVFLASGGADMINGADLVIDGGFTVK